MRLSKGMKNDIYIKYFDSDIFHLNSNNIKKDIFETVKTKKIHRIIENTKDDLFNVGKPKRIKRDLDKNKVLLSKSVEKKHKYYGESDIFFQKRPKSCERRKGVKFMPNILQKTTYLYEMRNVDDYKDYLKNYENQHRNNNNYNPEQYIKKITPYECYFKTYYDDNIPINKNDNKIKMEEKLNKYIHDKKFLKNEISKLNDSIGERKDNLSQEKRYKRQRRNKSTDTRFFADSNCFPKYNCRINQQIQMESDIFKDDKTKEKDYFEEAKEIYNRLSKLHKKQNIINRYSLTNANIKNNINFSKNKQAESIECSNNTIAYHGKIKMKDLYNIGNNKNVKYDLITGIEKIEKIKNIKKNKEKTENKIMEEMIESIPNLTNYNKNQIKMKSSVLEDIEQKGRLLTEFYNNKSPKKRKIKEVALKIGDKNHELIFNDNNLNKKPSEKYIMTYTSKGGYDKFDSNEIKNIFGKKGVQAYDIVNKNNYNGRNIKVISFKLKGQNDEKIQKIENELRKENYKLKIQKDNNIKNVNKEKKKENNENKKFKIMPKEIIRRKGFSNNWIKC